VTERRLFHVAVEITIDMVILAENSEQAQNWAADHWFNEVDEGCPDARILPPTPIDSEADVPYDGWLESHPYTTDGSATKKTVKEMLSGERAVDHG